MPPTIIGHYRIIGTLGEGGMGTVYEAEQDQPSRKVALKVIRPDFVSAELSRRFARESEVLGRLQHPGIAQIYEAGTAAGPHGDQSFFAMELVRGRSLTEYSTTESLDLRARLDLFARVCDAVHYAHQQGVIHRDLKPANILVDNTGQPKILDFGVARLTDADVQATRQTSVGEVVGTLQYMSPEQVNADSLEIDLRSDVYSLGVILYELLSGTLPYDLSAKMIYQAARVILIDEPAPLSSINRRLGGDVEIIVAKTLEKEKDRRYGSAEALASDVRRYLRDEPIVARAPSAAYQMRKFAHRNRALVSGLALAAVILVAGTVVSAWQAVRATGAERLAEARRNEAVTAGALAERRRAVADSALLVADSARAAALREQAAATASAKRALDEAAKARAINAFLQEMLASSNPANARGAEPSLREVLDQASARIETGALAREPEVRAAVASTIGQTYFGLGLYDQARANLDSASVVWRRTLGPGSLLAAQAAADLGKVASAAGDLPRAEVKLREGLAVMQRALAPNDDYTTETMTALAGVRYTRGDNVEAERLYRKAVELARSRHGRSGLPVAARLRQLGAFLTYIGRPADGRPFLDEALGIVRKAYGSNHPDVVDGLVALSDAQMGVPDYPGAEATLREALPIARTVLGPNHPATANVVGRLGIVLTRRDKLEEAETFSREALEVRIKILGPDHPDVQLARAGLGRLFLSQRRYAEADTMFSAALASRRKVLGEMSPAVASSLDDLGGLALAQEDWAGAAERFRQSVPIWRAAKIESQELNSLGLLAWSLQKHGQLGEAESIMTDVLVRRRALFGENNAAVGDAYEKLAPILLARGKLAAADSLALLALEIRRTAFGAKSPQVAAQLLNVAFMREQRGDTSGALPPLRESLAISAGIRPPADPTVIATQRWLAHDLCVTGSAGEGDSVIRAAVAALPADSTQVMTHRVRSVAGLCLVKQRRFADAEPLLLRAEAGLGSLPAAAGAERFRVLVAGWLAELYQLWGKPAEAAAWRVKRS